MRGSLLTVVASVLATTASADAWSEQGSFTSLHEFGNSGQLVGARDVAVSSSLLGQTATVYVADPGQNKLVRFSLSGPDDASPSSTLMAPRGGWDFGPHGTAAWNGQSFATGLATSQSAPSLSVFVSSFFVFHFFGESTSPFLDPRGVDVDEAGNVYVVDNAYGRVQKFTAEALALGTMNANARAQITFEVSGAEDVSVDVNGRVHVISGSQVTVFTPTGTILGQYTTGNQGYIDAQDLSGNTWVSQSLGTVSRVSWDTAWNPTVDALAFSGAASIPVFGLEFEEFQRDYHDGFLNTGADCTQAYESTDCVERLYVTTGSEVRVYGVDLVSAVQSNDAVARWRFDEPETECPVDLLCAGNIAVPKPLGGPVQKRVKGVAGYARRFNGSLVNNAAKSWFEVADDPSLNFGTGDFSIECWIRTEQPYGVILDKRFNYNVVHWYIPGYTLYIQAGSLAFRMSDRPPGGLPSATSGALVADGKWHHIAVTVDFTGPAQIDYDFYVDGELEDSIVRLQGIDTIDNDGVLTIGGPSLVTCTTWYNCPIPFAPQGFLGDLDELALYKTALSGSDVKNIYLAGRATKQGPETPLAPH